MGELRKFVRPATSGGVETQIEESCREWHAGREFVVYRYRRAGRTAWAYWRASVETFDAWHAAALAAEADEQPDAPDPDTAGFLPEGREGDVIRIWNMYGVGVPNPVDAAWSAKASVSGAAGWVLQCPPRGNGGPPQWDWPGGSRHVVGWRYLSRASDPSADAPAIHDVSAWAAHGVERGERVTIAATYEPSGELSRVLIRRGETGDDLVEEANRLRRIIGEIELALTGAEPATEGPDAWGPLAHAVAALRAGRVDGGGEGWETGPVPSGKRSGDVIQTVEDGDVDKGGLHSWDRCHIGTVERAWFPMYDALSGYILAGETPIRWRWLIRNGEAVR